MRVNFKKLNVNAREPTLAYDDDFCYDVYATSCEEVEPGIWKYGIGLAFEIKRDIINSYNTIAELCFGTPPIIGREYNPDSPVYIPGVGYFGGPSSLPNTLHNGTHIYKHTYIVRESSNTSADEDNSLTQIKYEHKDKIKLSIDFRPRSSVWKTGLILSNCVGTIDELYRGEVIAYFYEIVPGKVKYAVGDKIGQIKLGITLPIQFVEVQSLNTATKRGTKGFGSSDEKVK